MKARSTSFPSHPQKHVRRPPAFDLLRPLLGVIALTCTLGVGVPSFAAGGPAMLLSVPSAEMRATPKARVQERWVSRQKDVGVNFEYLDPHSSTMANAVVVQLFDGRLVTLDLQEVEERAPGNYTWKGTVRGQVGSHALLTVANGRIAGSITVVDAAARTTTAYQIQTAADGSHQLREVNQGQFPPDHPPGAEVGHQPPLSARPLVTPQEKARTRGGSNSGSTSATSSTSTTTSSTTTATAAADSAGTIDVLVVYSNQTAAAAGASIGTQIQQAIDSANLAYANSGISTRLRLVHYGQTNYSESGDFYTDLNRLTSVGDGYMNDVDAAREAYGADLVSLFVENGQYCGLAWVGPKASYAFSVVNRGCATGNLSFAHELAHNFGALHDPYVDPGTSPYAYGHGLVNPAGHWRTVMAYNDACAAAGTSCTRIAYFSNPNLTYGSPASPLGSTSVSNNARVLNDNAYAVANFRASAGSCSFGLSPASVSVAAGASTTSVSVSAAAGCAWNTVANASWVSVLSSSATTGAGALNFSVAANTGPARSGTITVGGQSLTVTQANGCTYTLSPASAMVASGGGTGTISLGTGAGCTWSTSSSATWLGVSSALSGTGAATVTYTVGANTGAMRTANLAIGGATFILTQSAASTSVATASPALSATAVDFGSVRVGKKSSARSVTLKNGGSASFGLTSIGAGGANPGDFLRSGTCVAGMTLAPGQSCTIQHVFAPTASGSRAATLSVVTTAGTQAMQLTGRGTGK